MRYVKAFLLMAGVLIVMLPSASTAQDYFIRGDANCDGIVDTNDVIAIEDSLYRGKYDLFIKCGGPGGSSYMVLSAVSKGDQFSYLILVEVQMVYDEDWDIAQHILDTFQVVGTLP